MESIPFNKPYLSGDELSMIHNVLLKGKLSGDGEYTRKSHLWLEKNLHCHKALLTHSCTAALEMAAILFDIGAGDEIIMPSYTFVSTANAFVLRGATPVFVDIRLDTLNIDEALIEQAITSYTKAIVVVHYAGVACDMIKIQEIANRYNLALIEDAAQGLGSYYFDKPLGTFGEFGALSFHETKNIISGEGGALLINDKRYIQRAEIIREKGTNRSSFLRGEVDKYTWKDIGSSYLPSELIAAFLFNQLENSAQITEKRLKIWEYYHQLLTPLEQRGLLNRPKIPVNCRHNAHIYYVILSKKLDRNLILEELRNLGIFATGHYVPLHSSPAGRKYGKVFCELSQTDYLAQQILRLPLWIGLTTSQQEFIIACLQDLLEKHTMECKLI